MYVLLCNEDFKEVYHFLRKSDGMLVLYVVLNYDRYEHEYKFRRSCNICKSEFDDTYFVKTNDCVVVCRTLEEILECLNILRTGLFTWEEKHTWAFSLLFGLDFNELEDTDVGLCMIYEDFKKSNQIITK